MEAERVVAGHYTQGNLLSTLLEALTGAGVDIDRLEPADLTAVEEFHIGGREATANVAAAMELRDGMRLLDVGSGIGGASRYFALEHNCDVTGVDLTEEFCLVATDLSARLGLGERTRFEHASALDLPFEPGSFDGAYMLHVGMNIEDKSRLFEEVARVLRPGGQFAIFDILDAGGGDPIFPTPWAEDGSTSFLVQSDELCGLLEERGFEVTVREDLMESARTFFREVAAAREAGKAPPVGIGILMGESGPKKLANVAHAVNEGRLGPWLIVGRKTG